MEYKILAFALGGLLAVVLALVAMGPVDQEESEENKNDSFTGWN